MSASGVEPLGSPRSGQSRRRADQEAAPYAPPDMARSPSKAAALVAEPYQSAVKSMETTHRTILMLRCKVVVVGDATVGKSALISMFHSGGACARARRARETVWRPRSAAGTSYPKQYVMTSWVDFRVKQVNIPDTSTAVELYLFDCAGQSIFNQIEANNVHYDNASFLLLVYDVTSQASFESCGKWLQQVRKGRSRGAAVPGVLVANKKDLAQSGRRCVTKEKGVEFAEANGLAYFETSALEGEHEEPFRHIAEEFAKKYEDTVARAEEN